MKILSWNVNGIRAIEKKGYFEELLNLDMDVICLQETKAEVGQLSETLQQLYGPYHSYFWSSDTRKGHAGVAIYSKTKPTEVVYGFVGDHPLVDLQGRVLTIRMGKIVVVNAYFPNGASKTSPLDYKLDFYDALMAHAKYFEEKGNAVIIAGDYNVAHTEIDLARPQQNKKSIGFLPEERIKIDEYINEGYVDVWRTLNPDLTDVYTYWDTISRARDRNVGWRIDYFFANKKALKKIKDMKTLTDFMGSDHCPIVIEIGD